MQILEGFEVSFEGGLNATPIWDVLVVYILKTDRVTREVKQMKPWVYSQTMLWEVTPKFFFYCLNLQYKKTGVSLLSFQACPTKMDGGLS